VNTVESEPWMADAACHGMTAIMFSERGQNDVVLRAKAICATCPVKDDCLRYALVNHIEHGIWGGLSVRARKLGRQESRTQGLT
jgi:WhiB family transcriptional regulator, redox-sensing transcriptional regulator